MWYFGLLKQQLHLSNHMPTTVAKGTRWWVEMWMHREASTTANTASTSCIALTAFPTTWQMKTVFKILSGWLCTLGRQVSPFLQGGGVTQWNTEKPCICTVALALHYSQIHCPTLVLQSSQSKWRPEWCSCKLPPLGMTQITLIPVIIALISQTAKRDYECAHSYGPASHISSQQSLLTNELIKCIGSLLCSPRPFGLHQRSHIEGIKNRKKKSIVPLLVQT